MKHFSSRRLLWLLFVFVFVSRASAQEAPPIGPSIADEQQRKALFPDAVPLNREQTLFLDKTRNRLVLQTELCLREGVLEMFICPRQTKEHEAVLSFPGKAQMVHAGLLALGAQPGSPARFQPKYTPPSGQIIDIFVNWLDPQSRPQRNTAQKWIRHATFRYFEAPLAKVPEGVVIGEGEDSLRYDKFNHALLFFGTMSDKQQQAFLNRSSSEEYQKAVKSLHDQGQPRELEADFVFAGSVFQRLEDGTELYTAEAGSLVCVANFGDAMIDIGMQSTASNDAGLLFEPWTQRLPPLGTKVLVELIPRSPAAAGKSSSSDGK